jgi:hypothetical protein
MEPIIDSGATFSDCRTYRYALWRIWDAKKPLVMFVGLNPSTANETEPDNTIKRVMAIAQHWDYGGFYMMNLFALVSRDPDALLSHPDPLGDNDGRLERVGALCNKIVFAWGNFKQAKQRAKSVIKMFPNAYALEILKDGSPKHPLYCKKTTIAVPFIKKINLS